MRYVFLATLITTLAYAAPSSAQNGPFGIEMGSTADKYDCVESGNTYLYICSEIPRPHSDIESYMAVHTNKLGISKIVGIGKSSEYDKTGSRTRNTIDKIAKQLSLKYGEPADDYDFLRNGSIWDEADEWAMAIRLNERYYTYTWEPENIDNVSNILLEAKSTDGTSTYFTIGIEFNNFQTFIDEQEQEDSSAF